MSANIFHLDFESRSEIDLETRGLHNYLTHPSTQVLMCAYAEGEQRVRLWQPHLGPMPAEIREALDDPFLPKAAWNAAFERGICKYRLGADVPTAEWLDPMLRARYLSVPGKLEDAGPILGLKDSEIKSREGTRLINLFCSPVIAGGKETLFGLTTAAFHDWNTHPADWDLFCEYCKQDVVAERSILKKLKAFPLPPAEIRLWELDQRINERGIPTDLDLVHGAKTIADRELLLLRRKLKDLTRLENPNSNDQMLAWVRLQGYPFSSLGKAFVARALKGEGALSATAKEVLEIRRMTSKTSVNKFDAILNNVNEDGRLRHQFAFMGASRTGRWSGRDVQLQNLARPVKSVEKRMDLAVSLVRAGDYDGVLREFGQPLEVASSVIRASFRARHGYKLLVCDLSAIENRVLGWLANCPAILNVFAENRDPYIDFATELYNKDYAEVTKEERNNSKPAVLGCGYQLGGGAEVTTPDGDQIRTGLMGYAEAMGVTLTEHESSRAVSLFRSKYKEVPQFWYALEKAGIAAVRAGEPQTVGHVRFECAGKKMLRILLPSGRALHYLRPEVNKQTFPGSSGREYTKDTLSYMGLDQQTRQWVRTATRGGHLTENLCQALARDILVHGIQLAEERGMPVVAHVHDEIVAEVPVDGKMGIAHLIECMEDQPKWAEGLPLAAAGFESVFYRKE